MRDIGRGGDLFQNLLVFTKQVLWLLCFTKFEDLLYILIT